MRASHAAHRPAGAARAHPRGGVHVARAPAIRRSVTLQDRRRRDGNAHGASSCACVANTGAYGTHGLTVQMRDRHARRCRSTTARTCASTAHVVYTNLPVAGAYRGYGAPQALFALEAHMDEIAAALGDGSDRVPRAQPRSRSATRWTSPAARRGRREGGGIRTDHHARAAWSECDRAGPARRSAGSGGRHAWRQPAAAAHPARLGHGDRACTAPASRASTWARASIKINDDGSFNLLVGATDLGTGSDTVLAQIAAETLGVPLDEIIVYSSDTDMTPFDTGAYASRTTYISGTRGQEGGASRCAADHRARGAAARGRPGRLGRLHDRRGLRPPDGRCRHLERDGPVVAAPEGPAPDHGHALATCRYDSPPPFAAQFAEVEVDIETGQVTVREAGDGGRLRHADQPGHRLGAGGGRHGAGPRLRALRGDGLRRATGRMVNPIVRPLHDLPRPTRCPSSRPSWCRPMEASGPFGAKAIAEIPMDGAAPAIAQRHRGRDRRPDQHDPVHAGTRLAGPPGVVSGVPLRSILAELSGRSAAGTASSSPPSSPPRGPCLATSARRWSCTPTGPSWGPSAGARWRRRSVSTPSTPCTANEAGLRRYALQQPERGDPGVCGGTMTVYLEPVHDRLRPCSSSGPVTSAGPSWTLRHWLGYRTVVSTSGARWSTEAAIPHADVRFAGTVADALAVAPGHRERSVVVVTRSHELDAQLRRSSSRLGRGTSA